jgi:hypothetical protein
MVAGLIMLILGHRKECIALQTSEVGFEVLPIMDGITSSIFSLMLLEPAY